MWGEEDERGVILPCHSRPCSSDRFDDLATRNRDGKSGGLKVWVEDERGGIVPCPSRPCSLDSCGDPVTVVRARRRGVTLCQWKAVLEERRR